MKLFFHKLLHWEYWPMQVVYFPIFFLWMYYALRAKSIFFFNASNPSIKNGGFIMESKKAIYDLIPQQYYPKTVLITEGVPLEVVLESVDKEQITYPFIVKPDIGLRGSAVKKINTLEELKSYNDKATFDYLIQDLIPYPNEIGVFYVRYPNQKEGKITGIVAKEFLTVTGDGISTIEELIKKNPRHEMQLKVLQKEYGKRLQEILSKEELLNVVPYGNHIRGAKFIDASHLISDQLNKTINEMCIQIPDFYFGRFDIMYTTIEELEREENFAIVELNGAASEPTHIYDPKHSIFFAWKELARHITYMYEISVLNHKNGVPYLPHKVGMQQYQLHVQQNKKILIF